MAERYAYLLGPSASLAKTCATTGKLLLGNFVVGSLGRFPGVGGMRETVPDSQGRRSSRQGEAGNQSSALYFPVPFSLFHYLMETPFPKSTTTKLVGVFYLFVYFVKISDFAQDYC